MTRILTILCAVVCSAALLIGYWAEGMRMKQARETSVNTEVAPTKVEVEKTKLPPVIAGAVVEFLEVATPQTPSKMVSVTLRKGDDLPVDPPQKKVTVKVLGSERVTALNDCPSAKAEAYENPDGDGSAYQEDVPLGLVYEEAMPNRVMSP